MSSEIKQIEVFKPADFRRWLVRYHVKEHKVALILHKKHTGHKSPSHRELMEEAICYGWIDTTIKRLDADKYLRHFSRRTKNSKWSDNTLGYARQLIKEKRMTPHGLAFFKAGEKKPTHDQGIPKNPEMPDELRKSLNRNKPAQKNFEKFPPSAKRTFYR